MAMLALAILTRYSQINLTAHGANNYAKHPYRSEFSRLIRHIQYYDQSVRKCLHVRVIWNNPWRVSTIERESDVHSVLQSVHAYHGVQSPYTDLALGPTVAPA